MISEMNALKTKIIVIILTSLALLTVVIASLTILKSALVKVPGRPAMAYTDTGLTVGIPVNDKMRDIEKRLSVINYPVTASKTVTADKLVPDSLIDASNNADILNRIISSSKSQTEILIPAGRYYIDTSINVYDKKNISIVGSDSKTTVLVNSSYTPHTDKQIEDKTANIFNIYSSKNIKISNISFDYLNHTSADGIITSVGNDKTLFNVYPEFMTGDKPPLVGGETITSVLTANDTSFIEEKWPDSGEISLVKIDDNGQFAIPMSIGKPGQRITCRFTTGPYISYVIHAYCTSGLYLENLSCYSCPAGFVLAPDGNSDMYFKSLNVKVVQGSKKLLGSNEDCLHLNNVAGQLVVKDCNFTGIGDDALNIHSQIAVVDKIEGNKATITSKRAGAHVSQYFAIPGETIEFFDKDYNTLGYAELKQRSGEELTFYRIGFDVDKAKYMQNVSCSPDTYVENCKVSFGRARGLLIQSKNAVIKNSSFENLRLSGVLASPDFRYWEEGGFCDNLLISGNVFNNCASVKNGMGVVHITSGHDGIIGNYKCKTGHKNISVIDNRFENCSAKSVMAFNVQNLYESNE